MPSEPEWLTADLLAQFNELVVSDTGENHFVRDWPMLESAAARPINFWAYGERDVVALAVTLLVGIGQNHPFEQGNKRTAFAAADYFLYLNGYELTVPDGIDLADLIVDLITGDIGEHQFIQIFSGYVEPA